MNGLSDFSRWSIQNLKSEGTSLEIDLSSLHFFSGYENRHEITICNDSLAPNAFSQTLDYGISFGGGDGECRAGKLGRGGVAGAVGAWDFGMRDGGLGRCSKKTAD